VVYALITIYLCQIKYFFLTIILLSTSLRELFGTCEKIIKYKKLRMLSIISNKILGYENESQRKCLIAHMTMRLNVDG
jgi:hypothetical protein